MADKIVSLKNISKNYSGVRALDDVDIEIRKAEIHALVGENGSGKSTLIKILSGDIKPNDGAEIEINGELVRNIHCVDSIRRGIQIIYQDLSLFPNLTVEENISLNQRLERGERFARWKDSAKIALEAMSKIGVNLNPDFLVGDLSIADQQLVAICRALTQNAQLIVMDEPTSSLTKKEVDSLFTIIRSLKKKGISTLFISHKLDEVFVIAERVTILKDGKKIGTYDIEELEVEKLATLMTGDKPVHLKSTYKGGEEKQQLLEVRNFSKKGNFIDINFKLFAGEILGITGPLGSGRTELALSLFGLNRVDEGEFFIDGSRVFIKSTKDAIDHGIGYVPENRMKEGLILDKPISSNILITILERLLGKLHLLREEKKGREVERWIKELNIKCPSYEMTVKNLSGGNQQRVVLAKWLATNPRIFIFDSPTAGIDVGAKAKIHDFIRKLASQGMGIIIISDQTSEVYHNCNRILIMKKGRIVKEYISENITEQEIKAIVND